MFWVFSKFHKGMTFMDVVAKKWNFGALIFVFLPRLPRISFPYETWQTLKTSVKVCHHFFRIFRIVLDFTIHAKVIWAKIKMGTGQHFFHECKWHAHIGDVFLNILISYLNFSELVWIFYEVFKVKVQTVKGQKNKRSKVVWAGTSVFRN